MGASLLSKVVSSENLELEELKFKAIVCSVVDPGPALVTKQDSVSANNK